MPKYINLKASVKDVAERLGVADQARDAYPKAQGLAGMELRRRNARFAARASAAHQTGCPSRRRT